MRHKYLLLFLFLVLFLTGKGEADYYNVQHWLIGSLEAGSAPSADGYNTYAYYPPTSDSYVTDVSGPSGNSKLSGRYMLNAFEIPGSNYAPGALVNVEVRGSYQAGPVPVIGSAAGYDIVPPMILLNVSNLVISAIRESGVILRDGDFFPEFPHVSIKLEDDTARSKVTRSLIELKNASSHAVVATIGTEGFLGEYRFSSNIAGGTYDLTATVWDGNGNSSSKTVQELKVTAAKVASGIVADKTVWRPSKGEVLTMGFRLSRDMPVDITGFGITGEQMEPVHTTSGAMGGRAGYNQVTLNGRMYGGGTIGNGIYIIQLTGDHGKTYLGKYKIVVAN